MPDGGCGVEGAGCGLRMPGAGRGAGQRGRSRGNRNARLGEECWHFVERPDDRHAARAGESEIGFGGFGSGKPDASQPRIRGADSVGCEPVADVDGIARRNAKHLTCRLKNARIRFGEAHLAARDRVLDARAEADGIHLGVLKGNLGVRYHPETHPGNRSFESIETGEGIGIQRPRFLVLDEVASKPAVGVDVVRKVDAVGRRKPARSLATLLVEANLPRQVAVVVNLFELAPAGQFCVVVAGEARVGATLGEEPGPDG